MPYFRRDVELALRLRELPWDTDVEQLVFELHAMVCQAIAIASFSAAKTP
ncbi:hypothetical protein IU479_13145 [Nocardia abscessus]|nr:MULTISPECIES: hypothetical protein [Nocardia]MBF6219054.1 hypothetical protein [Nocardia abscessus]MDE1668987.1 hypothetical protein [Nocardia gipuzkoensis]